MMSNIVLGPCDVGPVRSQRTPIVRRALLGILTLQLTACSLVGGKDASSSADATGADSPLSELFGWNDFDPVESRRQQLAVEEAVADCMREEGFDYQPVDYDAQFASTESDEDQALYQDPEAFGKKYGYGVVHNYEIYEEPYIGTDGEDSGGGGQQFEDPNQDYLGGLSSEEVDAYYAVLYGDQQDQPTDTGSFDDGDDTAESVDVSPPLEEQGCQGRAQLEVVGEDPLNDPEIQAALSDIFSNQQSDPRLDRANDEWADCMATFLQEDAAPTGFVVDKPEDMYQMMDLLKAEATGQEILPLDPKTGEPIGDYDSSEGYGSFQNEDGTGFAMIGPQQRIPDAELERLRGRELSTWKQDWDCQNESGVKDVRLQVEQDQVDDLLAKFPELAD